MADRLIFQVMRALAVTRRQRILAELHKGPVSMSALAENLGTPLATMEEDVAMLEPLGVVKTLHLERGAQIALGPNAHVDRDDESVTLILRSPEGEQLKVQRPLHLLDDH